MNAPSEQKKSGWAKLLRRLEKARDKLPISVRGAVQEVQNDLNAAAALHVVKNTPPNTTHDRLIRDAARNVLDTAKPDDGATGTSQATSQRPKESVGDELQVAVGLRVSACGGNGTVHRTSLNPLVGRRSSDHNTAAATSAGVALVAGFVVQRVLVD